jgi:hypothetical protein
MRKVLDFIGRDPQLTLVAISWLGICYVIYEDTKNIVPWWGIALACALGGYLGFLIITKAIRPYFLWSERKLRSWLRVK